MKKPMRVTITGADESIDPIELAILGAHFPGFVEWGILASEKREGTARYPGEKWRSKLTDLFKTPGTAKQSSLALHLCGGDSRAMMEGSYGARLNSLEAYKRIQINGWLSVARKNLVGNAGLGNVELILQARSPEFLQAVIEDAEVLGHASVLFDPSGGRGVLPESWPAIPSTKVQVGIAGGITPDNVMTVLEGAKDQPVAWIDMESGVRTSDRFDLVKVYNVLEQVASWNAGS